MSTTSSVPCKVVYTVHERAKRSIWLRIGSAFVNHDGSLTVRLSALPLNGTLIIRDADVSEPKSTSSVPLTTVPRASDIALERSVALPH